MVSKKLFGKMEDLQNIVLTRGDDGIPAVL